VLSYELKQIHSNLKTQNLLEGAETRRELP